MDDTKDNRAVLAAKRRRDRRDGQEIRAHVPQAAGNILGDARDGECVSDCVYGRLAESIPPAAPRASRRFWPL